MQGFRNQVEGMVLCVVISRTFARFLANIPRRKRWWHILFWVNLIGSLYGFMWYWPQLRVTPVKYWLIVPDSPGSTLLFSMFLLLLLTGHVQSSQEGPMHVGGWVGFLAALAWLSNMKYGLWTATVLPEFAVRSGILAFDIIHLSLSHFGMWVQGFLFARYFRPNLTPAVAAFTWVLGQDYIDYWLLGTHPTLPADWLEPSARAIAVTLSLVWGTYLVWQARRQIAPT